MSQISLHPFVPPRKAKAPGDNYGVLARLKPGATIAAANAQLKTLTDYIRSVKGLPKTQVEEERALPLQAGLVYDIRTGIRVMWGAVIALLLLGCVNIAGLLLARSTTRTRELALRSALGAGRFRIVLSLVTESILLGVLGAGLGVWIGRLALHELVQFNPREFTLLGAVRLDERVLIVTVAMSFVASLLFGLVPALQASRVDLQTTLAKGSRTSAGQRRGYTRYVLVFAEVALTVLLITSAGLLVRNFLGTIAPYPGFDSKGLLVASASLADPRYAEPVVAARLFKDSTSRIEQIPGVRSAAVALAAPYTRPINQGRVQLNGRTVPAGVELNYVTPSYFQTLGIHRLNGRTFSVADNAQSPRVVVVNETFVRMYSPHQSPVGANLEFPGQTSTIIGVVNSVQENNHLDGTLPLSFYPEVYLPVDQFPPPLLALANQWFSPVWLVRMNRSDAAAKEAMQKALQSVDRGMAFADVSSIESTRAKALGPVRYRAWLISVVSGLAMLLAGIGIYGLVAQAVSERNREMGLRIALGATIGRVVATCIAPAVIVTFAGLVLGTGAAVFASRLLRDLVWNISATDPATYAAAFLVLAALACLASLVPALRLARITPAQILRDE